MSLWNRNIFRLTPRPFGLDLSDLSLKAVFLDEEGERDKIVSYGAVNLPFESVSDGKILKEEAVVSGVKTLLKTAGPGKIHSRRVFCSLPETKAFLRIVSLPKMDASEVEEAIKWEIEANIPLTLDQVYYDYQLLDRNITREQGKMSVLVVAVARSVVDQFVGALESAGLEVVGFETESIAQARILLPEEESDVTTLIIDIGDRRTSFLIALGNIPVFTSSIPLSSQMFTDSISKSMKVPFEEAERIKIAEGIGSQTKGDPLFRMVEPVLSSLTAEMERSVDFYLNTLKYSSAVDKVVLCGGGSNMRGILPYLARKMGKPVEFGNPWVNLHIGKSIPVINKKQSVQYSTALGLALRGIRNYENPA
ncbi:MAG: type IV pilus assembly protein PilM [Candidatus Moraniibacteriota bacterium]|nr:MAG: type IV pilus assembly protein PilM [Candidatus Moranbacteria bacterium]